MLLTYTQEGARWVEQCLPGKRVIALGNTIDVDGIADIAGTASPVRFGDPQLLAVGRLTEDKAYECLIETFLKVKEQLPNAALTVIGDGPQRSLLEQQAGADLGSAIRILGALYDERQLAPHFIGADFFVIAGAAGLSVNHALAYGLPVICYGRGQGLPNHHPEIEYVVDGITGFICLDAGADSFARLIIDAYREGASRLLRPSVKEFVRDRLRLARVVDRFGVVDRYL
jgi:glycosyltransferase involved in cell wall biosynthesis